MPRQHTICVGQRRCLQELLEARNVDTLQIQAAMEGCRCRISLLYGPAFTLQSNLLGALSGEADRSIDREWSIRSELGQGEIDVVVHHARFAARLISNGHLPVLNRQLTKRELRLILGRSGLLCSADRGEVPCSLRILYQLHTGPLQSQ